MPAQNKIFEGVKGYNPKWSNFDLSFDKKLSFDMGELIPALLQEVMPGDMFKINAEIMLRVAPMIFPLMHRVNVYMHYFFVPNRIIWDDWEDFITGGDDGTASPTLPTYQPGNRNQIGVGTTWDYFGLPTSDGTSGTPANQSALTVSELPFRAYYEIWNEYYRDENLQSEIDITTLTNTTTTVVKYRAWEKDYFTSALPNAQKGTAVTVAVTHSGPTPVYKSVGTFNIATTVGDIKSDGANLEDSGGNEMNLENLSSITLSSTVDINDLRLASRLQEFWERRARAGSRYTELIQSEFSVRSSDARLQRPEYLGGGRQPLTISEVIQTADDGASKPIGSMYGHGISVGSSNYMKGRFEEHGYIIGMLSVIPRTAYMQGMPKTFLRDDKFDFAWPAMAHLGEQAVENRELYIEMNSGGGGNPTSTFGYQQRYAEYKYNPSQISGEFRTTLEDWHLARKFASEPVLNEEFIDCEPDEVDRIFASGSTGSDKLWCQIYFDIKAKRPLPYFSDPRL
jgi:hypothetical protein